MTATIRQLERPQEPEVIEFLEETLARARAGEITGVLILEQGPKHVYYAVAGVKNRLEQLGFLSAAMHKLQE